jgi:predicted DNA-binding transcriptional regulator AlpA
MMTMRFIRKATFAERWDVDTGVIEQRVRQGLITRPISLGGGTLVAWPLAEIEAIETARIGGWDDDRVRNLVHSLHEARKVAADVAFLADAILRNP